MVSSRPNSKQSRSPERVVALLRILLLIAGIICLPLSFALAQTSDTQTSTEPAKDEEKKAEEEKAEEEEEIQTQEEKLQEEVTVTGTRVEGRVATDTPSPVDIIDSDMLQSTGATETGRVLQLVAPSFNFSSTTISDGTDIIRPATLRSLGSDQVLVLINGKRQHQQALLNVQQTIARGEAGTDINAIPLAAIDHIEVLRDGAAAQYGSDAIAGVINIILKDGYDGTAMFETGQTYEGDGGNSVVSVNKGFKVGEDSMINVTGEYRDRGETNRAGVDSLRVDPPRVTQRIGDADAKDGALWFNTQFGMGGGHLYAFGGYSQREGNSSGFFRSAGDGRTIPALYPNGFLPTIITKPIDSTVVVGYKRAINPNWNYDFAANFGRSEFKFREENTANVSWFYEPLDPNNPNGPRYGETPTSADTGTLLFNQRSVTFDLAGKMGKVGQGPLNLAAGFEWRQDGYTITPGEPVSYTYGRTNNRSIEIFNQTGTIAQPGTQGFPGWSPAEAVDGNRDNTAFYVDAEAEVAKGLLLGGAVRFEHYSDFGNTVTGKFSARYDFNEQFGIRGTISNGFRAPGIQQALYSQRSTNLNAAGVLTDTLTARNGGDVTKAFGIPDLTEETSKNYSFGIVAKPSDTFRVTVDTYRIDIDNRIVFSSNIQPEDPSTCTTPGSCPINDILAPFGVGQVLFFTNAINTSTKGLDIVALYDIRLGSTSLLSLEGAFSFTNTKVTDIHSPSTILPANVLFDQSQVTLIEDGQPGQHDTIAATYYHGPWAANVRFNYFGEVSGSGFTPGFTQVWGGKWLTDMSLSYTMQNGLGFMFGGLNVFDVFPDKWDPEKAFPFPQLGFIYGWETLPFGMNGGSFYGRVTYKF